MAPPKEMDEVLRRLSLRIGVYIPDDLFEVCFAPGKLMNQPGDAGLDAAKGHEFACEFKHYRERKEGVF